jgi:non-ribosomal peptide synthetase component F
MCSVYSRVHENYPGSQSLLNSRLIKKIDNIQRTEYPLSVTSSQKSGNLVFSFLYQTKHFNKETIERLFGYWKKILEEIAEDFSNEIDRLDILSHEEKQSLLVEWNATLSEYPKDKCTYELFEEQVQESPDATVAVYEDRHLTYSELNSTSNQLARYLRKQGVKADTVVAICVDRSLEMLIGILGILKSGGAYVPLDPSYPEDRLKYMLEDTRTRIILTQSHLRDMVLTLASEGVQIICLDEEDKGNIVEESTQNLLKITFPQNLAYVIYTSGSTGNPKGVQINHENLFGRLIGLVELYAISADDIFIIKGTYSFDASIEELILPIIVSAKGVFLNEWKSIVELERLSNQVCASVLNLTPELFFLLRKNENIKYIVGGDA